ncbi:hypothetical protein P2G88_19130 [Aliiglaciecola sp. CAU 1673]|uniref:hypothetical protein n=1 Tax=Aliiglaciecola sp. CAU 1673 TaxID=3032595 RepID=UPI0023DAD439|nr:hypothetical protein [Aliiglaciecola sp. CAU 1673]MDF2180377.1 hypothetical protein [Aliiglaciecola sp. CAU 1673]
MKLFFLMVACLFSSLLQAQHSYQGIHGMVLLAGQTHLYAYHLPLYHPPHDYQILYRLTLPDAQKKEVMGLLKNETMVTLEPASFDLMQLIQGQQLEVKAKLYQGHFERNGKLLEETTVAFVEPLFVAQITRQNEGTTARYRQVTYDQDVFLVHLIDQAPSFDHILALPTKGAAFNVEIKEPEMMREQLILQLPQAKELYWETQDFQ